MHFLSRSQRLGNVHTIQKSHLSIRYEYIRVYDDIFLNNKDKKYIQIFFHFSLIDYTEL